MLHLTGSTSDLSLRFSPKRESSLSSAFRDEEEEEELPSILLHQGETSFFFFLSGYITALAVSEDNMPVP